MWTLDSYQLLKKDINITDYLYTIIYNRKSITMCPLNFIVWGARIVCMSYQPYYHIYIKNITKVNKIYLNQSLSMTPLVHGLLVAQNEQCEHASSEFLLDLHFVILLSHNIVIIWYNNNGRARDMLAILVKDIIKNSITNIITNR